MKLSKTQRFVALVTLLALQQFSFAMRAPMNFPLDLTMKPMVPMKKAISKEQLSKEFDEAIMENDFAYAQRLIKQISEMSDTLPGTWQSILDRAKVRYEKQEESPESKEKWADAAFESIKKKDFVSAETAIVQAKQQGSDLLADIWRGLTDINRKMYLEFIEQDFQKALKASITDDFNKGWAIVDEVYESGLEDEAKAFEKRMIVTSAARKPPLSIREMVTLVANDGHIFRAPYNTALRSGTIRLMLEMPTIEAKEKKVAFKNISADSLRTMVNALKHMRRHIGQLHSERLWNAGREVPVTYKQAMQLLKDGDFLELQPIIEFASFSLAKKGRAEDALNSFIDYYRKPEQKEGYKEALEHVPNIVKELARQNYLLYKKNLEGLPKKSYAFSVRELNETQPYHIMQPKSHIFDPRPHIDDPKILAMNDDRLNSLEGILDIKKLDTVTNLFLDDNQLQSVPEGIFPKMPALKLLSMRNNQLRGLPADVASLKNLKELRLERNPIPEENIQAIRRALPRAQVTFEPTLETLLID